MCTGLAGLIAVLRACGALAPAEGVVTSALVLHPAQRRDFVCEGGAGVRLATSQRVLLDGCKGLPGRPGGLQGEARAQAVYALQLELGEALSAALDDELRCEGVIHYLWVTSRGGFWRPSCQLPPAAPDHPR